jgi:D-alanyl-D-alanine dipeptidase
MQHSRLLSTRAFVLCLAASLALGCQNQQPPAAVLPPQVVAPAADSIEAVPVSAPDYDTTQWTELTRLAPGVLLDLRYATDDNFVHEKMYACGRCFLRPVVARAIAAIQGELEARGYGLKMYDCYRPRPVQWRLWKKVPDPRYVADPREGSMHNRGTAVDLTLVDSLGRELNMGTEFDFFGKEAWHDYAGHSDEVLQNRKMLRSVMEAHRFGPTSTEWWHYSYRPKSFLLGDWEWPCDGRASHAR